MQRSIKYRFIIDDYAKWRFVEPLPETQNGRRTPPPDPKFHPESERAGPAAAPARSRGATPMTDEEKDRVRDDQSPGGLPRRDFVALSPAAGLSASAPPAPGKGLPAVETNVEVRTPDGACDAAFIRPEQGPHPGRSAQG